MAAARAPSVRVELASEDTFRQAFTDMEDFAGIVHTGLLGRGALRRLWRGVKKQVAHGESAQITVAGLRRLKPAQTDLVFCVEVADGPLSTGTGMHAEGLLDSNKLALLDPADRDIMQRWEWGRSQPLEVVSCEGLPAEACQNLTGVLLSQPRPAPCRITFAGLMGMRHLTNVRLDRDTEYCDACLRPARNLLTCARCEVGTFCSAACQRAAWPAHKAWCRAAAALPEGGKDTHAVVPSGKFELEHTLRLENRAHARQRRQMQRHTQVVEIRKMVERGLLPAMTPGQIERLRKYLVGTGGVLPENQKDLDAILTPTPVVVK